MIVKQYGIALHQLRAYQLGAPILTDLKIGQWLSACISTNPAKKARRPSVKVARPPNHERKARNQHTECTPFVPTLLFLATISILQS